MHTIFYFTGTGNCLTVAKKLKEQFDEDVELIRICRENMELATREYSGKVGLVYPVYSNNLPFMVLDFLEALRIEPGTYVYTVVTWGGLRGTSDNYIHAVLAQKGLAASADFSIKMPHNGIVIFDAPSPEEQNNLLSAVDEQVAAIAAAVKACEPASMKRNFILRLISPKVQKREGNFFDPKKREKDFFADDKCVGCGICVKVCPAVDIELVDGKPRWKGQCENCMACFQWCPQQAIQFKDVTQKRTRYHNPDVELKDMLLRGDGN